MCQEKSTTRASSSSSSPLSFKMLYRYKVGIFTGLVASLTFLLAYITGPKSAKAPAIRVLYLSFSDHATVKRLQNAADELDDTWQVLKFSADGSLTIDMEEWELGSVSEDHFYQNNILLECTASFPISWKYAGYGSPVVTEKNVRIHGNFNDSSTFTYLSLLNLMPLTEKSTGEYTCFGASNETNLTAASVHLYVPGDATFLIDYDITIEAAGEDQIVVPCPVSNASVNVSLYFKNRPVSTERIDNLLVFNPKVGFFLTPKFVEEQNDPWGEYYCKNEETKRRSGVITIQPQKDLIVNATPESKIVFISKPNRGSGLYSSPKPDDKIKFLCQAKEEVTLKFLRVLVNPLVHYDYNASSSFPFSAFTEVDKRQFRNASKIYCRTLRNSEDLHSWKVLFSSLSQAQRTELMDFQYDSAREEFSCCSPSNKRATLTALNCNSISECRISAHCLLPGHKCEPDKVTVLPERMGCVRYKLQQRNDKNLKKEVGDEENFVLVESGLLQCFIDGKSKEHIFFASRRYTSENGSQLNTVSEPVSLLRDYSTFKLESSSLDSKSFLRIEEVGTSRVGMRRFVCKGAKYFLAVGFLWQTVHTNNELKFHFGRDTVKNEWIQSQIEVPLKTRPHHGVASVLKRIYCVAPLWNSDGEWVNVKLEVKN